MSKVEFDELLRQRIDSEELKPPAGSWERLAALLPKEELVQAVPLIPATRRKLLPWSLAGAAAIAAVVMAGWMFTRDNTPVNNGVTLSENAGNTTTTPQNENTPSSTDDTITPQGKGPVNSIFPTPGKHNMPDQQHGLTQRSENEEANTPEYTDGLHQTPIDKKEQYIARDENNVSAPAPNPNNQEAYKETYTFKTPDMMPGSKNERYDDPTSIALGGGVNYGTLNTGYTLGLSARRFVSDKVFVDGTVAVMMNQKSDNTLNYTGSFIADQKMLNSAENTRARPSNENYYYPAQGLYYIQFNPSIGYKLGKKVAVSAGGDFQQMLQNSANNETLLFTDGEDARLFPTFDVGLTGKTEVNITPALQAGLLYREGLNNMIRNESRYVNRRYVQVQVKYSLPIK